MNRSGREVGHQHYHVSVLAVFEIKHCDEEDLRFLLLKFWEAPRQHYVPEVVDHVDILVAAH